MKSQNVRFEGVVPADKEFEHPAGASLARALEAELGKAGWKTAEFDNWRDCGWSIPCSRGLVSIEIVLSQWEQAWMLQVAPAESPGLLGGLFGKKASASPSDVLQLARDVHRFLSTEGHFSNIGWRWDGFPDKSNATPEPLEK
jgi:hypothetical protein